MLETMADRLGATIGAAVSIINPEVVVIGGGVAEAGEALLAPVREAVTRYTPATHREGLRIVAATLGERAGVTGAGLLAWDRVQDQARAAPPSVTSADAAGGGGAVER
jgi:glucokinase